MHADGPRQALPVVNYDYEELTGPYPDRRRVSAARAYLTLMCFPDDPRHGTAHGYDVGCRCERCRAAYGAARRERRKDGRP